MARNGDDEGAERTEYGKKSGFQEDKGAERGKGGEMHMSAGGDSGSNNGPTGSARVYPKKAPNTTHPDKTDWNPMKIKATCYGVGGV